MAEQKPSKSSWLCCNPANIGRIPPPECLQAFVEGLWRCPMGCTFGFHHLWTERTKVCRCSFCHPFRSASSGHKQGDTPWSSWPVCSFCAAWCSHARLERCTVAFLEEWACKWKITINVDSNNLGAKYQWSSVREKCTRIACGTKNAIFTLWCPEKCGGVILSICRFAGCQLRPKNSHCTTIWSMDLEKIVFNLNNVKNGAISWFLLDHALSKKSKY